MNTAPKSSNVATLIKETGQRATEARIAVIETLLSADHALTHQEIEQSLAARQRKIDKVTLYRVLTWALNQSLAHKMIGDDRVWRYSAAPSTDHAHFNCLGCGHVYCLESLTPAIALTLPDGYKLKTAEVSAQGLCPRCNH